MHTSVLVRFQFSQPLSKISQTWMKDIIYLVVCMIGSFMYIIFSRYWDTLSFLKRVLSPLSRVILLLLPITSPYLQWTLNLAKKFLTNDKITASCRKKSMLPKHYIKKVTDKKNDLWKTITLTSFQKFTIAIRLSRHPCLLYCMCCVVYILF